MRRNVTDSFTKARAVAQHPLDWVFGPLENLPGFQRRKLFGCVAAYLDGRLHLAVTEGEEPWNGLLVATCRNWHPALQAEWSELESHPVLGKWLYVSQENPAFEPVASQIARAVARGDARIGVDPLPRKHGKSKPRAKRQKSALRFKPK